MLTGSPSIRAAAPILEHLSPHVKSAMLQKPNTRQNRFHPLATHYKWNRKTEKSKTREAPCRTTGKILLLWLALENLDKD